MDMVFSVYAAMTLGLLMLQLWDYLMGRDRVPFTEHKMLGTVTMLPGVTPGSRPAPEVHFDRAA